MVLNHLPISAYSGEFKIFVNVARLEIGQLFTQGVRLGHPCTSDKFLVSDSHYFFALKMLFYMVCHSSTVQKMQTEWQTV